ncbi:MAG TPA: hypothetical protein VLG11_05400 [Candidatus Saccharimonadales bacterium]|nr:hypothetical protein [Candidatus Saccharimonadales bacterium]
MIFKKCPKPERQNLAPYKKLPFTTHSADFYTKATQGYNARLPKHLEYWEQRKQTAENIGATAIYDMANQLVEDFTALMVIDQISRTSDTWLDEDGITRMDHVRRDVLGKIAFSTLVQHIFPEGHEYDVTDAKVVDRQGANILPDCYMGEDRQALDPRLHVTPEFADDIIAPYNGTKPVWYRADDLYVRRTEAAVPSTVFATQELPREGIAVDFSQLITLFPYLAARQ